MRRQTLGLQVGARIVGGLDVVGEGLLFFPEETAVAEPGVSVDRDAWQANAGLLYAFDRSRRLVLYAGLGLSCARNTRAVVVDGLRHRRGRPPPLLRPRFPRRGSGQDVRTAFPANLSESATLTGPEPVRETFAPIP